MLRQTALVLLVVAIMVQADAPWRRNRLGNRISERGFPKIVFERDPIKRVVGERCLTDADCDEGEFCEYGGNIHDYCEYTNPP